MSIRSKFWRRLTLCVLAVLFVSTLAFEAYVWAAMSAWTAVGGDLGVGTSALFGPQRLEIGPSIEISQSDQFDRFLSALRRVNSLPFCTGLSIQNLDVPSDHISRMLSHVSITSFRAENTNVDDSCLGVLSKQRNLEYVGLVGVPITAAGLSHLTVCPRINRIDLMGVPLSEEDIQILSAQFGDRIVVWEQERKKPLRERRY